MPKLRKHSQKEQSNPPSHHQDQDLPAEKENESSSNTFGNDRPNITGKLKYKDRLSLIKEYEKHSQSDQNEPTFNAVSQTPNENSEDAVANYLNTLPDDDLLSGANKSIPCEKTKKQKIKRGNKFFSNQQLQNDALELKQESDDNQIRIERKTHRGAEHLMEKVQQKALTFKNRLCFKDLNKDHKFKNNIKDKLKSLETFEEAEIVVEIPKLFGGRKSHVQAAIFLKNNRDSGDYRMNNINNSQAEESKQQNSLPKDRKTYYEEMQIHAKRTESMTESAMKACFKKSYLDQTDFIQDLEQKRTKEREQMGDYDKCSEASYGVTSKPIAVDKSCHLQSRPEEKGTITQNERKEQEEDQTQGQQTQLQSNDHKLQENYEKQTKIDQKPPAKKKQAKPAKAKPKKTRKRKGAFNVQDYIQVEAEDSESQNGAKQKQQSETDGEDNSNISSFIGEELPYSEQEERNAHKKFVSDMILQEQRRYSQMRLKVEKQYLEEQKREEALMERMRQAKAAYQKKDAEQNSSENTKLAEQQPEAQSSTAKKKNLQKLEQLGKELGLTIHSSEQYQPSQPQEFNRVKLLENCIVDPPSGLAKLKRQGLKGINLNRHGVKEERKGRTK